MVDRSFCLRKTVIIPSACRELFQPLDRPALACWRSAGVVFSGVSDLVAGYRIGDPRPSEVMVVATVAGRGWAVTPAATHDLRPGTLYVGVPGQPVGWGVVGDAWRIAWWYLRPSERWHGWRIGEGRCVPCPSAGLLASLASDVHERATAGGLDPLAVDAARLLLAHLERLSAAPAEEPSTPAERFASMWREVALHPGETWPLPALAERLGLSLSTVQRLARARLGEPLHRALVKLRLAHARKMLRGSRYPMELIAERVGYADAFTFSAAYRRWAGRPPSAERGRGRTSIRP